MRPHIDRLLAQPPESLCNERPRSACLSSECQHLQNVYSSAVSRRFRRIVLASAVLPLVMLIGLRSAWAAYACSIDGEVREACCCPEDPEHGPVDATRIDARCCCDITHGESAAPPDARTAKTSHADHAVSLGFAVPPSPVMVVLRAVQCTHLAYARPPPPAVPTYLANRTIVR